MAELIVISTNADVHIYHSGGVYNTVRNAAAGTGVVNYDYVGAKNMKSGATYFIWRAFIAFDTSALTAEATILSATLKIYGAYQDENDGQADLILLEGSQADPVITADYNNFGGVALSDDLSNWEYPIATDAYNIVALNATGLGLIDKTGLTKYCIRVAGDVAGVAPVVFDNYQCFWDYGEANPPTLTIQYTPPPSSGSPKPIAGQLGVGMRFNPLRGPAVPILR
jgi:hypothetical protein